MPSLFNLTAELQQLYTIFTSEADEHGEVPPDTAAMIAAQLDDKEGEIGAKLDNYIDLIRRMEGEAKIAQEESTRYYKLAEVRENAVVRLKASLKFHLESLKLTQAYTATQRRIWIQANGGVPPLILAPDATPDNVPETYVKVVKSIDTAAIRNAIKSGETLPFAHVGEKGTHIRIS